MDVQETFLRIGYLPDYSNKPIVVHKTEPFTVEGLKERLIDNIKSYPDNDVAVLLSGGIDSSLIAYLLKESGKNVQAYCVSYTKDLGEEDGAITVAKELDIPLKVIQVSEEDCLEAFPEYVKSMPGLSSEWSGIPLMLLMKKVKEDGYTSVFTGDGGDDVFGGYIYFKKMIEFEEGLPARVKSSTRRSQRLFSMLRDVMTSREYSRIMLCNHDGDLSKLNSLIGRYLLDPNLARGLSKFTIDNWLYKGMIHKNQAAINGSGVQIRAPFLCEEVIKYVDGMECNERYDKKPLREMLSQSPLKFMSKKPKLGFKPPYITWFQKDPWKSYIENKLGKKYLIHDLYGDFTGSLWIFRLLVWEEWNE